jgi:hypothetical protein
MAAGNALGIGADMGCTLVGEPAGICNGGGFPAGVTVGIPGIAGGDRLGIGMAAGATPGCRGGTVTKGAEPAGDNVGDTSPVGRGAVSGCKVGAPAKTEVLDSEVG